jgi:hypothetical protein
MGIKSHPTYAERFRYPELEQSSDDRNDPQPSSKSLERKRERERGEL